jgi:AraC-like DNA-binding protein
MADASFIGRDRPGVWRSELPQATGMAVRYAAGHVGIAREIPAVLRELGVEPDGLIAAAGFDPALLDDAENALSLGELGHLLAVCARRTACSHFGLLVGARASASCFGIVGLLMQHSGTVGVALGNFVEHVHLYERGTAPALEVRDGTAMLRHANQAPDKEGAIHVVDAALAATFRIMRGLCGPDWSPIEILVPHVPTGTSAPFRDLFRAPIRFGQGDAAAVVFSASWLDHLVAGADPAFCRLLDRQVRELESRDAEDFAGQLRRSLRTALLSKKCTAEGAAQLFSMHRRTMSRRLRAEGQSFQQVVDEVRYDLARGLLEVSSTPLSEVTAALGYSEASAFTRAFKRWSGQNPSAWRVGNSGVASS